MIGSVQPLNHPFLVREKGFKPQNCAAALIQLVRRIVAAVVDCFKTLFQRKAAPVPVAAPPAQQAAIPLPDPYRVMFGDQNYALIEVGLLVQTMDAIVCIQNETSEDEVRRAAGIQNAQFLLHFVGDVRVSAPYDLQDKTRFIAHVLGPDRRDPNGAKGQLEACVKNALNELATRPEPPKTIVFPLIGLEVGYSLQESIQTMFAAIQQYVDEHRGAVTTIKIVVTQEQFEQAKQFASDVKHPKGVIV